MQLCSIASGSSGNCTYIGSSDGGVLIDAGVSAKQITLKLDSIGVSPADIGAVFVTHEHSDHVGGLRVFASKNKIPVYATHGTVEALKKQNIANGTFDVFEMPEDGIECRGQFISAFATSHDSAESCGYLVTTSDERKIAVATDTGTVTDTIREAVSGCDMILAESNHDIGMLRNGSYPFYLKERILSDHGHLSNPDCATQIGRLIERGTTHFLLGHLSQDNNRPQLADSTVQNSLPQYQRGKDYLMGVAPVETRGGAVIF